ncbi:gigasin-6-like [Mytilus trossulus]|uniref:gigasin-6-like n=1 Tax=Mytilus trossulus TaxID=6551 RepID=UPI0030061803
MAVRQLIVGFLFVSSLLAVASEPTYEDKVDQTIREIMNHCKTWIPGLTVSVVKDGQTLFAKGYGVTSVSGGKPVTSKTLFQIGSLSKAFGATLLVKQLDDNQNYNLNTKVKDLMDSGVNFVPGKEEGTVVDILAHRMGVPDYTNLRLDPSLTRENLQDRFKHMNSVKSLGKSFVYSNMMYGFATHLSEKLGGHTWEELVESEIFQSLGMTASTFVTTVADVENVAQGYDKAPKSKGYLVPVPLAFSREWGLWAGSGAIMSNAEDMTKWMKFHLNGGLDKHGNPLMSQSSFDALHAEHISLSYTTVNKYFKNQIQPTEETGYGLGFKLGTYRGKNILLHGGSTFGYRSFMTLFPDQRIGVFTSMNGEDQDDNTYKFRVLLHNFLSDVALNVSPWLNASSIQQQLSRPRYIGYSTKTKAKRSLTDYVGQYNSPIYGNVTFEMKENNKLGLVYGNGTWNLWPKSTKDEFKGTATRIIQYLMNIWEIVFIPGASDDSIVSVEINSFCNRCDETKPPTFSKINQ